MGAGKGQQRRVRSRTITYDPLKLTLKGRLYFNENDIFLNGISLKTEIESVIPKWVDHNQEVHWQIKCEEAKRMFRSLKLQGKLKISGAGQICLDNKAFKDYLDPYQGLNVVFEIHPINLDIDQPVKTANLEEVGGLNF